MLIAVEAFAVDISIHAPVKGATPFGGAFDLRAVISIHAPVKGATLGAYRLPGDVTISIHAPVKGATYSASFCSCPAKHFNPRSREGSDYPLYCSFHSSTADFNPRSREGSDRLSGI